MSNLYQVVELVVQWGPAAHALLVDHLLHRFLGVESDVELLEVVGGTINEGWAGLCQHLQEVWVGLRKLDHDRHLIGEGHRGNIFAQTHDFGRTVRAQFLVLGDVFPPVLEIS